jgi:hypothetical protein
MKILENYINMLIGGNIDLEYYKKIYDTERNSRTKLLYELAVEIFRLEDDKINNNLAELDVKQRLLDEIEIQIEQSHAKKKEIRINKARLRLFKRRKDLAKPASEQEAKIAAVTNAEKELDKEKAAAEAQAAALKEAVIAAITKAEKTLDKLKAKASASAAAAAAAEVADDQAFAALEAADAEIETLATTNAPASARAAAIAKTDKLLISAEATASAKAAATAAAAADSQAVAEVANSLEKTKKLILELDKAKAKPVVAALLLK